MNKTEARLIVLLSILEPRLRNTHTLAAKVGKSFSAVYNYLRILEAGDFITKIKSPGGTFFQVKDDEVVENAKEILAEVV